MADLLDEHGNPILLTDEQGNPVRLTDEHGNPMHLTGVAMTRATAEEVGAGTGKLSATADPWARVAADETAYHATKPDTAWPHATTGTGTGTGLPATEGGYEPIKTDPWTGATIETSTTGAKTERFPVMGELLRTEEKKEMEEEVERRKVVETSVRRSGSSSSSSSEDDGAGGRRKKKGFGTKIKEKLTGKHKEDYTHEPTPTAATATHEKKSVMEKIKEKLPGHHSHSQQS